jgi:hypothetical protein
MRDPSKQGCPSQRREYGVNVRNSREARVIWVLATLAMFPASLFLWFVGGTSACGEEVYDTPPGSLGDAMCQALVDPVAPWALLASTPLVIVALGGFIALRRENRRLFVLSIAVPVLLILGGVLVATALF